MVTADGDGTTVPFPRSAASELPKPPLLAVDAQCGNAAPAQNDWAGRENSYFAPHDRRRVSVPNFSNATRIALSPDA